MTLMATGYLSWILIPNIVDINTLIDVTSRSFTNNSGRLERIIANGNRCEIRHGNNKKCK